MSQNIYHRNLIEKKSYVPFESDLYQSLYNNQLLLQVLMQPNSQSSCSHPTGQTYQQIKVKLDRTLLEKFPHACYYDQNNVLQIKNIDQLEEQYQSSGRDRQTDGRGGNNASQNLKKSLRALLKSKLKEHFSDFDERYFKRYQLKSQKENYFLIFMFLYEFVNEENLSQNLITEIIELNKRNIRKYISHSQARLDERPNFHAKNIEQLTKYLQFNVNYSTGDREWREVEANIRSLFLKKKANAELAIQKAFKIVNEDYHLKGLFVDLQQKEQDQILSQQPLIKVQQVEENIQQDIHKN